MSPIRPVVLLLPGQGFGQPGLAVEAYHRDPAFAAAAEEVLGPLDARGDRLRDLWLSDRDPRTWARGEVAQPLLFMIGYATGRALQHAGVVVDTVLGHSIGEFAAAALAGVLSPAAAARALEVRCRALAEVPEGGMLGACADQDAVTAALGDLLDDNNDDRVTVAARNAPDRMILAGAAVALDRAERALRDASIPALRVPATEPWHAPAMEPVARQFADALTQETLQAPRLAIVSAATGRLLEPDQARSPSFWGGQVTGPVLFWEALTRVLEPGGRLVLDVGRGSGLGLLARRHPTVQAGTSEVLALLGSPDTAGDRVWARAVSRAAVEAPDRHRAVPPPTVPTRPLVPEEIR